METVVNLGAAVAAAAKAQQSYTDSPNEGTLVLEMLRLTYKACLGIALVWFFFLYFCTCKDAFTSDQFYYS